MSGDDHTSASEPTAEERDRIERALDAIPSERDALVRTFTYRDGVVLSVMLGEAARAAAPGASSGADAAAAWNRYLTLDAMFELLVSLR